MAVLVLCLFAIAQDSPVDERKVLELVSRCGAEAPEDREEAMKALRAMGTPALPILKRSFPVLQGESRRRVMRVIHDLADPVEWAREFVEEDTDGRDRGLEQDLRERTLDLKKAGQVLAAVVRHPAATMQQRKYALDLARRNRLPGLWPAVLEVLLRDEGDESQAYLLANLKFPEEALPDLLKFIPSAGNGPLALALLDAALRLKAGGAPLEACVANLLESGAPSARSQVLDRLKQGFIPVSASTLLAWWRRHADGRAMLGEAMIRCSQDLGVNDLSAMLASWDVEEAGLAIDLIGRKRNEAAVPLMLACLVSRPEMRTRMVQAIRSGFRDGEIRKWFAVDKAPRAFLASLAADLRLTTAEPELIACLADPDAAVRRAAASASAALGLKSAGAQLMGLLRDRDGGVRREALMSLAILKRSEATDLVLDQLRSPDPILQAAAVESLALIDPNRALAALATAESMAVPIRRHALAALIVSGGPAVQERALQRLKVRELPPDVLARLRLMRALSER